MKFHWNALRIGKMVIHQITSFTLGQVKKYESGEKLKNQSKVVTKRKKSPLKYIRKIRLDSVPKYSHLICLHARFHVSKYTFYHNPSNKHVIYANLSMLFKSIEWKIKYGLKRCSDKISNTWRKFSRRLRWSEILYFHHLNQHQINSFCRIFLCCRAVWWCLFLCCWCDWVVLCVFLVSWFFISSNGVWSVFYLLTVRYNGSIMQIKLGFKCRCVEFASIFIQHLA